MLFKVLVHGYLCGIYSSRKLEEACQYRIDFRWLLEDRKAPDHSTLARFRTGRCKEAVEDLFYQFVRKLEEAGETGGNRPQSGVPGRDQAGKPCGTVHLCVAKKRGKTAGPDKRAVENPDRPDHIRRSALTAGRGSRVDRVCQGHG